MIAGSAIVVTYNSAGQIGRCLEALRKEARWQRIVVDNASQDDTIERAEKADPAARVVKNRENIGFAAAANQGARLASGNILIFLNPDTIAQPGALDALAAAFDDKVGAAGGRPFRGEGGDGSGFLLGRFPPLFSLAAEIFLLNRLWSPYPLQ